MFDVVVHDLVVDLIGEDDETVASGEVDHRLEDLARVDRAGRVVGVDDDDCLGIRGDFRREIVEIRQPAGSFVAQVVHGSTPAEADDSGPQRVVRRGDQHLVAGVEETLHGHADELGDPVAEPDIFHVDAGEAF